MDLCGVNICNAFRLACNYIIPFMEQVIEDTWSTTVYVRTQTHR